MITILQKENPVLRKIAEKVPETEISSEKIQKVILDMKTALMREEDGVAIAAPQIGESLRIFIVSHKVFEKNSKKEISKHEQKDEVYINPKIVSLSRKKEWKTEGCLSVRRFYGETHRHDKIKIEALSERGEKTVRGASGFLAHIFQHEIDHLNGILFTDHARKIEEIPPEKKTA